MEYWNKDNFEGLDALAAYLSDDIRFSDLAEYCRLRSAGLRSKAFKALDRFIEKVQQLSLHERINVINIILELAIRSPQVHQFMTSPLLTQVIRPGLIDWLRSEPDSAVALRWDGWLNYNSRALERVLEINPQDDFARKLAVVRECIAPVGYATHHIDETVLLLDLYKIETLLVKAESLLHGFSNRSPFLQVAEQLAEQKRLIDDWKSFLLSGNHCFRSWCIENGRQHNWITAIYYKK
jgi:hypothetical protein